MNKSIAFTVVLLVWSICLLAGLLLIGATMGTGAPLKSAGCSTDMECMMQCGGNGDPEIVR